MIQLSELIDPELFKTIPWEHQENLRQLWFRLNVIRRYCGIPMVIRTPQRPNAGYRTLKSHKDVYQELNRARQLKGQEPVSVPLGSLHLVGAASDLYDHSGALKQWIVKNQTVVREVGFWMEHFDYTPNFCHLQIYPPASGELFFKPY